jgi:hypothetical protein
MSTAHSVLLNRRRLGGARCLVAPCRSLSRLVLVYVPPPGRREFAAPVGELGAVWLSNEGPGVLPGLAGEPTPPPKTDPFLLVRDGHTPLALADGHGAWVLWL